MNKVVTIHLDGIAYQLEEGAYEELRAYLDQASVKLADNPDKVCELGLDNWLDY